MIPTTRAGLRELVDLQAETIATLVDENDECWVEIERWSRISAGWSELSNQQMAQIHWLNRKLKNLAADVQLLIELLPPETLAVVNTFLDTQWEIQRLDEVEP